MKLPQVKPITLHRTKTPGAYEIPWGKKSTADQKSCYSFK